MPPQLTDETRKFSVRGVLRLELCCFQPLVQLDSKLAGELVSVRPSPLRVRASGVIGVAMPDRISTSDEIRTGTRILHRVHFITCGTNEKALVGYNQSITPLRTLPGIRS